MDGDQLIYLLCRFMVHQLLRAFFVFPRPDFLRIQTTGNWRSSWRNNSNFVVVLSSRINHLGKSSLCSGDQKDRRTECKVIKGLGVTPCEVSPTQSFALVTK